MTQTYRDFFWVILLPISWLYSLIVETSLKLRKKHDVSTCVISVGNLHLGGTGKTPLVSQIANYFEGKNTAIISRGYKSQLTSVGSKLDKNASKGPQEFGDEPWEMSRTTASDIYVGADRLNVIKNFNIPSQYDLVLLDDGFQHVQIKRTTNLLIVPGDDNPWESSCLPLGDLREGLSSIKRATLIGITCSDPNGAWLASWKKIISEIAPEIPCFIGVRKLRAVKDGRTGVKKNPESTRFGAFCGIGRPKRFLEDMESWATIFYSKTYPDHHAYTKKDVEALLEKAKELSLEAYITTAKDFYKVADFFREFNFPLLVAQTEYEFEAGFWKRMEKELGEAC